MDQGEISFAMIVCLYSSFCGFSSFLPWILLVSASTLSDPRRFSYVFVLFSSTSPFLSFIVLFLAYFSFSALLFLHPILLLLLLALVHVPFISSPFSFSLSFPSSYSLLPHSYRFHISYFPSLACPPSDLYPFPPFLHHSSLFLHFFFTLFLQRFPT